MTSAPKPLARFPLGTDEVGVFRNLFTAYPDALIVADSQGTIVLANPSAAALFGFDVHELVGLPIDALVPDAVRPRHAAYRQGFAQAPRARPMGKQTDLVARRKDGSEVIVEIALSPLQDHGHPLVVAAVRDIGAYPRMKQALQRAQYSERLAHIGRLAVDERDPQILLDEVPVVAAAALGLDVALVYLLEPNGLEMRIASIAGEMPGETVGVAVAIRPDTSLGFVMASGRSLTAPDYARETRFKVPQAYLDAGLVSALAVPISDHGRTIGVLALRSRTRREFGDDEVRFVESLSNLLASSLQRTKSEEALQHAQRLESVGQLTGGIAHDFNNLLTVIQGNLQVLGDLPELAEGSARELVDAASRATKRGADLTGKLLAFSRRQVLQPASVDAVSMIQSLADLLRRTLDQRIRIDVHVSGRPLEVLADPGQLEAALLNIAINARDAMPNGGTLRFDAEGCAGLPGGAVESILAGSEGDYVRIGVSDSGSGMSSEVKERALEPFFTTKEPGRGTGLGLSTVYGFITQSKGTLTLESELGRGTTVALYLPRPRLTVPAPASIEAGDAVPAGLSVLLVEDDAEVRAVMRRFLVSLGCDVSEEASAEQALLSLGGPRRPDLLLSDIALGPGMRGTELATRMQERFPGTAVVLMSGFSAELLEADGSSPPEWELLRKPCSREELAASIARVFAGRA